MGKLLRRVSYWLRSRQLEDELNQELEFHREMKQQGLERSGLTPGVAAARAKRELGNTLLAREDSRGVWIWPWLDYLWQDVRYGGRLLRKSPGFTFVAIASLALGIGINTAVFTALNAVFFRPVPGTDTARLYVISADDPTAKGGKTLIRGMPFSNFQQLRARNTSFEDMAASTAMRLSWKNGGQEHPLDGRLVTSTYFDVLGVQTIAGRRFLQSDYKEAGGYAEAILGYRLWSDQFNSDSSVVGKSIVLNSQPFSVIGIAPKELEGTDLASQVYVSADGLMLLPTALLDQRGSEWRALARVKTGVPPSEALRDLNAVAAELAKERPAENAGKGFRQDRLVDFIHKTNAGSLVPLLASVAMTAVALVFVVACLNLANLLLARGAFRQREVCIRAALGGSRARLLAQLLTESALLAAISGVIGFVLAGWALRPLLIDMGLDPMELTLNRRVLIFAISMSAFAGAVFGLVPAFRASRPDVATMLHKTGGSSTSLGWGRDRFRRYLLIAEIAFSLLSLLSGIFLVRLALRPQTADFGYEWKNLASMSVDLAGEEYSTERGWQFVSEVLDRVRSIPGVDAAEAVAGTGKLVLTEDEQQTSGSHPTPVMAISVSPDYFAALRVPLLEGRPFNPFDRPNTAAVAVVNQSMAESLWPGRTAIGRQFHFAGDSVMREVIGVVRDFGYRSPQIPQNAAYLPMLQAFPPHVSIEFRTTDRPLAFLPTVRNAIQEMNSHVSITNVRTMQEVMNDETRRTALISTPLFVCALLSLSLAFIGIYGMTMYAVAQRTQELGLRMALGAGTSYVIAMVLKEGLSLILAGVGTGVALSSAVGPLLFSRSLPAGIYLPADIRLIEPMTLAAGSVIVVLVALLASYLPARRATQVDPVVALRYD